MTPVAIATEDELSEAIALRLISELETPHDVTHKLRKGGFGYLSSRMANWRQMSRNQVVLVLTDLDRANCLLDFRNEWLNDVPPPPGLLFRIAVREVESWLLADHVAMRSLFGNRGNLPNAPDELADPKRQILSLARRASREVQADMLRTTAGNLAQGLGYNRRLSELVNTKWSPQRAASRSPSLARTRLRIEEVVSSFVSAKALR